MIHYVTGDMFARPYDIRVCPVNCVGVMGAGLAKEFRRKYPVVYDRYRSTCFNGYFAPGQSISIQVTDCTVVCLPTKRHWRDASRIEDVANSAGALREYLVKRGAVTAAVPALGCGLGGLDWQRVKPVIEKGLGGLKADVYVYEPGEAS